MSDNPEIIGFDLGHGESALALTRRLGGGEPVPLEVGGRSFVTAVGRTGDGRVLVGRAALEAADRLVEAHVRFKRPDFTADPTTRSALRLFAAAVFRHLAATRQVDDMGGAIAYVGCPSGWTPDLRAGYEALMQEAGLPRPVVVPESRAAFLHAREAGDLAVTQADLGRRVLLVDVGSSTTDMTLSVDLNERPVDAGNQRLGAGLIDAFLVERAITTQAEPGRLRRLLERRPGKRLELDLKLRALKEEWFTAEAAGGARPARAAMLFEDEAGDLLLRLSVDAADIDAALDAPLDAADALGGRSWRGAFAAALAQCRESLGAAPDLVILTGGAARMGFLAAAVAAAFPDARLIRGREPELAIAKGLALFGRATLRARAFEAEVEGLVRGREVERLVARHLPDLYGRLADAVAAGVMAAVVRPAILRWRAGEVSTLNDLETEIEAQAPRWLQGEAGQAALAAATGAWFERLRPTVHTLTDPLCARHGVAASALDLPPDTRFSTRLPAFAGLGDVALGGLDEIATLVNLVASAVIGTVTGGAHMALLVQGPAGWVAGAVLGFLVLWVGQKAALERAKSIRLPTPLRWLVTEGRIDAKLGTLRRDFAGELRRTFEAATGDLAARVAAQLGQALRQRADDAVLRFGG
ncbi:MAG: hypothetical protein KDG89_01465 [Geminicoccaceae bacterium]|nr:hypothetical protein [Geminicoccaceae bacterium]